MTHHYTDSDLRSVQARIETTGSPAGAALQPRKKRKNLESQMQRAIIKWWRLACRGFRVPEILLFSIPNGGGGGEMRGHWLKLEGQRKGVPDLFLAVCRLRNKMVNGVVTSDSAAGLFLELKTPEGRLKPEQEVYHQHLRAASYRVEVVRSFDEAVKIITEYLT